jgi:hypothetical protein
MNLPSSFRRFLRKARRYAAPVGATIALRGCPCPPEVFRPPQPYTSSIAVDADTTLDATPASWEPWCTEKCGEMSTECFVRVNTSEGNSLPAHPTCDQFSSTGTDILSPTATWLSLCSKTCGEEQDCLIGPNREDNNKVMINCVSWWKNCAGGRGTEGIDSPAPIAGDRAALALAEMAALEAESVSAFTRLARELGALGAPRSLRKRAARSRRDEMRHARSMASLATRRGATISRTNLPAHPLPNRPLADVALENAIEGCVRETYGAWIAWQQARHARDPELRATMRRIAMDEARHAALAWDIHRWAMARLDGKTREHIARAMDAAWTRVAASAPDLKDPAAMELGLVRP